MRLSKLVLWAMVSTVGLTAATMGTLWLLALQSALLATLATGVLVLCYLGVAFGCAVALERDRAPWLMVSGIVAGLVALIAWITEIWVFRMGGPIEVVITWPAAWALLALAIGLLLLFKRRKGWWIALRRSSFVLLAVLAAQVCLTQTLSPGVLLERSVLAEPEYGRLAARLNGAMSLLAAGAVVTVLVGAWIPGLASSPEADSPRRRFWLQCPRCRHEQQALTGAGCCAGCGLRIRVELT